ncbi:hypothetical protein chiPu_0020166 [Chiloscyllium punctatum]|uniref:Uncharacterized protein n=1 Tax=Chiloscyllium punctatum TaxID=137246 RepID=A0A401RUA5_CHIPU|nr:hypothetical protein [Chiloscyllium punctatum]
MHVRAIKYAAKNPRSLISPNRDILIKTLDYRLLISSWLNRNKAAVTLSLFPPPRPAPPPRRLEPAYFRPPRGAGGGLERRRRRDRRGRRKQKTKIPAGQRTSVGVGRGGAPPRVSIGDIKATRFVRTWLSSASKGGRRNIIHWAKSSDISLAGKASRQALTQVESVPVN